MAFSLADLCEHHLPALSPSMISQDQIDRVVNFSRLIPAQLRIRRFGFEHSLSAQELGVDLGFVVDCTDQALGEAEHLFLTTTGEARALWSDLQKMLHFWNKKQSLIEEGKIDWVGLAFDFRHAKTWPPMPNFYFPAQAINAVPLLTRLHDLFGLEAPSANLLANLRMCCEHLVHSDLDTLYLGLMVSRQMSGMRLCISKRAETPDFLIKDPVLLERCLSSYNNPNRLSQFWEIFEAIRAYLDGMVLLVDVGEKIGKKIGIECYPAASRLSLVSQQRHIWDSIFKSLGRYMSEVAQEKCLTLLFWISAKQEGGLVFLRTINHLKFIIDDNKIVDTKVYITCDQISLD